MQAFDQDVTLFAFTNPYRGLLTFLQYTFGEFAHKFGLKRFLPLDRHIDAVNFEDLVFHQHGVDVSFSGISGKPV